MFASLHTATLALGRVTSVGSSAPRLTDVLRAGFAALSQRQALARLDDRTLEDIGLTRAEALAEAQRPIWDIPANRYGMR